jgi:radical SAM protein with 4Fe4S-binding SPASM domain
MPEQTLTGEISSAEYMKLFNRRATECRTPLTGGIELTRRCNLRCVHCYLRDQDGYKSELETSRLISILDEITDAGCLNFLITGGDPFMREDFLTIYCHAKKRGLLVTVFTNGTLISERDLEIFQDLPPRAVEITLYGATENTYEKITGVKGSYKRCMSGIQGLIEGGINVQLKTVLMTLNSHEFYDMEKIARDLGVKFRFDAALFPRFNGDKSPIKLRVSPEEAVEKEFSDNERTSSWCRYYQRFKGASFSEALYTCGAGTTNFHIDVSGNLQPCLMIDNLQFNLREGSFLSGWKEVMPHIKEKKIRNISQCGGCEKKSLCNFCPAFFRLENSAEDINSDYLCALGRERYLAIQATDKNEG